MGIPNLNSIKPPNLNPVVSVMGSSFADPADYEAWLHCKADGNSDEFCYSKGDNCRGAFGLFTGTGAPPMVALPPEIIAQKWGTVAAGAHKPLIVTNPANGKFATATLEDLMPHLANIKNGAGMDQNPATCAALGLAPPVMARVTYQWV